MNFLHTSHTFSYLQFRTLALINWFRHAGIPVILSKTLILLGGQASHAKGISHLVTNTPDK